ncbi:MAG: ABC transporter permease [Candidatus Dadabacteria bacterium]|nr:ABC transporter permease [Candidatus Dadabacteria bacterium]MCY4047389.1 ABC transporter permease [Candidatus Dadabacteria bacterium]
MITGIAERFASFTGGALKIFIESVYWCKDAGANRDKIFRQISIIGADTLLVAAAIGFSGGAVLALQTGPLLADFGIQETLGGLIGIAVSREIGPVMCSILVAGRLGSAITAEIASMRVYDEIDALVTMKIDPVKFLVMPRLIAFVISMPVLVLFIIVTGWAGGAIVGATNPAISLSSATYFNNLGDFVTFSTVLNGVIKALVFGVITLMICCKIGLETSGGPRQIGVSVTRAVVSSIVMILVCDYFISKILLVFGIV